MSNPARHARQLVTEDDFPVPLAMIAAGDRQGYRGRGRRLRKRGTDGKTTLDGKTVVEALLDEYEEPIVQPERPKIEEPPEHGPISRAWYEQDMLGIFYGTAFGMRDNMAPFLAEGDAAGVEEVLNQFEQEYLAPKNLSYTAAFELGLVVFLGKPNQEIKLILTRKRDKLRLPPRLRTWLKTMFKWDDLGRVDITTNTDPPYTANHDVVLGDFITD